MVCGGEKDGVAKGSTPMGQGIKGALDLTRKVVDGGLEVKREAFVVVAQFRDPDMMVQVRGAC